MPEELFATLRVSAHMPRTRFQGSKRKLAGWIGQHLEPLDFETALDAFGGTAAVSYELKRQGKTVTYNDILKFNHLIGTALIENDNRCLSHAQIDGIVRPDPKRTYDNVVERSFHDIYFTDGENRWIDIVTQNIGAMVDPLARAMAYYALFQSALVKRPYNLFHRRNLYMRKANVSRSFGNKVTWDRPFEEYFRRFAAEINAAVFDNGRSCRALNGDAVELDGGYDLVYIDTPYVKRNGTGVPYRDFYHFLEGLVDYGNWIERIDWSSKHRRLIPTPDPWTSATKLPEAFDRLFARFCDSHLVVSYRNDGTPSIEELERMLKRYKRHVRVVHHPSYQYALSTNKDSKEVLLIAT